MSEERKIKRRRRRIVQGEEKGFWGFLLIVLAGAIAVLLSMIV